MRDWIAARDLPVLVEPGQRMRALQLIDVRLRDHEVRSLGEKHLALVRHVPPGGTWRDIPPHLLPERFQGVRLRQPDGSATYQLASVVDDIDFGITHVIRGSDHRPNEPLHRALTEALGATAPEYIHLGLILRPDGKQLSRRSEGASVASLRDAGIPPEAVRRYLEELGTPRHDVHLDLARIRSLAVEALDEARQPAASILEPPSVSLPGERETLERFRELRAGANGALDKEAAKAILRELKAVGGNLRAVRRRLTGRESGPELWSVLAALPREETLRRIDAAL